MGYVAEKVKIDVEYVDAFIKKRKLTSVRFGETLGYNANWWSKNSIRRSEGG